MIALTNYHSGNLLITDDTGHSIQLNPGVANRLILFARMHGVQEFVDNLPRLIPDAGLVKSLLASVQSAKSKTDRWNFKEKFARLHTVVKGHPPADTDEVVDLIRIG